MRVGCAIASCRSSHGRVSGKLWHAVSTCAAHIGPHSARLREPHHVGGTTSVTTGGKGVTGSVKVVHRGETSVVRFDSHSSDSSLKEAIAGALALPIGSFSLREVSA
jgi:hypothetical protein